MSQTPVAEPSDDPNGFTCGTLLACCLPGLSKKKPEESGSKKQDQPKEQEHPQVPSRAASLEKLECSSLYSGSNIVFDFLAVEPGEGDDRGVGAIHGYCPSPCFDLPVERIRTAERYGVDDAPATSAFVFDGGYRDGAALKKMASCLAPGTPDGTEARPTHLVRFLSASDSGMPVRPAATSVGPAKGR
ncbi:uncharacterized protein LOC124662881 [Lolium rigidum]|jgi:hypothetical protein|uniref:uncharacterized protein LOC124662881 n=1 Tax=Lolium rigidum TaxID=89674 RepID=UPI001F5E1000|nr:uncharacterized protein LOC124662881 [Lolium rigidum]XP_051220644.1 uncharacterized protein LOC127338646 [Lolium perenne]